uniref:Protein phosphatase n=1 Tax=Kalanchoe fedtschenkoi TaxID=63787 RepID=A0A7N0TGR1_KALFE
MAIPTLRASPHTLIFLPNLAYAGSTPKQKRLISCILSDTEIKPIRQELCLSVGTHLIPHPKKVDRGGEDAFLVSSYNGGVIIVADGVSGWAEQNVDPSLFPKELLANASKFVGDVEVNDNPQILIQKAHADTFSKGSATIIVAMLENNGTLKIANVGDCGLRIIRGGQIVFSTSPQEHYFDCPYQLSSEVVGQTYLDAMVCSVNLMEGDTVVMGSDGLFDNVFDQEIVATISQQSDVVESAKALAILANAHSTDTKFDSPYIIEARSRGFDVPSWKRFLGVKLTGGKLDDITVVVGHVQRL